MCTDVVIEENTYYMVLKKLDGYDWSMLMLVPTSDHYAQMCLRVADNGIGMSKEFRNSSHPLAKKIPILAMTANAFSEDVQNAFQCGHERTHSKTGGYEGTDKNSAESSDGRRSGRNFKLKKSGRVFIMDGKNKTERQCRYA